MKRNDTERFLTDELNSENIQEFVESGIPSSFYFIRSSTISKFLELSGIKVLYLTKGKEIPLEIRVFGWKEKDAMKLGFVQYAHEQQEILDSFGITQLPSFVFYESNLKKVHTASTLHLPEIFKLLEAFQKESSRNTFDFVKAGACMKNCLILFNQRPELVSGIKDIYTKNNIPVFLGSKAQEKILREQFIHEDFTAIFVKRGVKIAVMLGKTRAENKIINFVDGVINGDYKYIVLDDKITILLFPTEAKNHVKTEL